MKQCRINCFNKMKKVLILFMLVTLIPLFNGAEAGNVWILLEFPAQSPQTGDQFETAIKFTTSDASMGSYSINVNYNPNLLQILQITTPSQSEFSGNTFFDQNSFSSGSTVINAFQTGQLTEQSTPQTFATIKWKALGASVTSADIKVTVNANIDSFWRPVEVFSFAMSEEVSIPTLSEWGMVGFVLLLLFIGIFFIRGSGARGRGSE